MEIGPAGSNYYIKKTTDLNVQNNENIFKERLKKAINNGDKQKLQKSCKDFEALFLKLMYKEMKASVPKAGLIPESMGHSVYESMLNDELIDETVKNRSMGLADFLFTQLATTTNSVILGKNHNNV